MGEPPAVPACERHCRANFAVVSPAARRATAMCLTFSPASRHPATIGATGLERVYDQPGGADRLIARSTGVAHTWVNGVATRRDGCDIPGVAAGRVLRS